MRIDELNGEIQNLGSFYDIERLQLKQEHQVKEGEQQKYKKVLNSKDLEIESLSHEL